ncbi:MAG: hypothetical protein AAF517_24270 [Planctomycetota bacterium]
MNDAMWRRIRELWNAIEPLRGDERERVLGERRQTDPEVVGEVERILQFSRLRDRFLGGEFV